MDQHSTATNSAFVQQVHGDHYSKCAARCPHCGGEIQHWDFFADFPHLVAAATKYLVRFHFKGGLVDLDKAQSYLDKLKAVERAKLHRAEAERIENLALVSNLGVTQSEVIHVQPGMQREVTQDKSELPNEWVTAAITQEAEREVRGKKPYTPRPALVDTVSVGEQETDTLAAEARARADAFANNATVGPTPWQKRHPNEPTHFKVQEPHRIPESPVR